MLINKGIYKWIKREDNSDITNLCDLCPFEKWYCKSLN